MENESWIVIAPHKQRQMISHYRHKFASINNNKTSKFVIIQLMTAISMLSKLLLTTKEADIY